MCSFPEGSEGRGLRQSGRGEDHNIIQWVLVLWRHPSLGMAAKVEPEGGRAEWLPVWTIL